MVDETLLALFIPFQLLLFFSQSIAFPLTARFTLFPWSRLREVTHRVGDNTLPHH